MGLRNINSLNFQSLVINGVNTLSTKLEINKAKQLKEESYTGQCAVLMPSSAIINVQKKNSFV